MEKLLYYFYLLCFVGLLGCAAYELIEQGSIAMAILIQLLWGPVSMLHCFIKFLTQIQSSEKQPTANTISVILTVAYFLGAVIIGNINSEFGRGFEDILVFVGLGVIPWTLLAFFTYSLHRELFPRLKDTSPLDQGIEY